MPEPVLDTQCVSYEHYCMRHKTEGEAEKKLSSITQQSQFEINEDTTNTSGNSGSGIEALELYKLLLLHAKLQSSQKN